MMQMKEALIILADVAFEHAAPVELLALYDASATVFEKLCPARARAARAAAATLRDAQKKQLEFRAILNGGAR